MRRVVGSLLLVAAVMCGGSVATAGSAPTASRLLTIAIPAPHGEIPPKWVNHPGPLMADVLLPPNYDPHQRYPLLFLLHGLGGSYQFFLQQGLLPDFYKLNAITVMPDGGPSGWYTDWWNDGARAKPAWETYELDTVLPTVLRRFPILPERRYHAIAGISMGGLGAGYLGGRLPGFFGTVASLSGFVDPQFLGLAVQPAMAGVSNGYVTGPLSRRDHNPVPIYGPPTGFYATGHNPTKLAVNLRQTRVYETTGTGLLNRGSVGVIVSGIPQEIVDGTWEEGGLIYPMSEHYDRALTLAGVDVTYQVHSGGHDLPAFHKEIAALLSWGLFKPVPRHPHSWINKTVAQHGQLWDVRYDFATPPTAVARFHRVGDRLTVSAAGPNVTLTTRGGCIVRTATPATVRVPPGSCR
jgi:S-formylglutathione hydrolase FrmB